MRDQQASFDDDVQEHDDDEFAPFFDDGTLVEVIGALKPGKEASVYVCRARPDKTGGAALVAAKVYTPQPQRGFRDAAMYDDGRQYLDERVKRAVAAKTAFGRRAEAGRWVGREYERLLQLHAAGVAIPRPIAMSGRVILMELMGDGEGVAPQLRSASIGGDQLDATLRWLLYDIELMLANNVVHGDLSPYNILWWQDRSWIIDFPQAVDPRFNRNARMLLERDLRNVCVWFVKRGARADPARIAADLWRRFLRAQL